MREISTRNEKALLRMPMLVSHYTCIRLLVFNVCGVFPSPLLLNHLFWQTKHVMKIQPVYQLETYKSTIATPTMPPFLSFNTNP